MLGGFMELWLWPAKLPDDYWWQRLGSLLVFMFWFIATVRLAIVIMVILAVIDLIRGDL